MFWPFDSATKKKPNGFKDKFPLMDRAITLETAVCTHCRAKNEIKTLSSMIEQNLRNLEKH